ncbi:MAG: hypothetical protein JXR34_02335 [Bacteroidales bacterium]|nr:hypothetical protein [Bacteroidales bacterium]
MINNSRKFNEFRNRFHEFHYINFTYSLTNNELNITFHFKVDDFVSFNPNVTFQKCDFYHFEKLTEYQLRSLVFHIGMVELISYWKALVPKKVVIHPFQLTHEQIKFWKKLYFHGLGEFFFLNGIEPDFEEFMTLVSLENTPINPFELALVDAFIIPVGGGKDSVVTLELLKDVSEDNVVLIVNPREASLATAGVAGFTDKLLIINRSIDKELLRLNSEGYLNGHTPFSAMLAFVTLLAAAASGRKHIALSNEGSANEPTVAGTKINHQYSKSLEFEQDFRNYVSMNISPDLNYFSFLRPLSELQIAAIFSKYFQHFPHFKSCNVGSKKDIWCGKCPKCLFTFIILSPFLEPQVLVEIFGHNLLEDSDLEQYFDELTGVAAIKPFECIGTVDEVNMALCLARQKYTNLPFLMRKHQNYISDNQCVTYKNVDLSEISNEHFLDSKLVDLIMKSLIYNE